jgi:2-methylcitrate dehydratase PrpD
MSMAASPSERTGELAGFLADVRAVPDAIQAQTLAVARDGIAALLAAANPAYSTGQRITRFVREQGGTTEASVVGGGFRTSVTNAALANGTMGYACDVEPHHPEAILHPIAIMVPTALALAEKTGASGRDFLAAVAIGCEVEYRVSMSIGPVELYNLGFHPSAVAGCFGATACAAFLLKLDRDAIVRALGLAACQASGLMAWESDPTENSRPFQMGMAARNGVTAALLAQGEFGGPMHIFDHGHTVFRAFSRNPRPELLTRNLGADWAGISELAIKPYSTVSFLHPALDALFALVGETKLEATDIRAVRLRFPRSGVHCVDGNPLKSHCAQYVLAVALARGAIDVTDLFIDRRETDKAVADLATRVAVIHDDELDRLFPDFYASILEIDTHDGRTLSKRQDIARGYPEAPMTQGELDAKFERLAGSVASPARVQALRTAIDALPHSPHVTALADLLRAVPDANA